MRVRLGDTGLSVEVEFDDGRDLLFGLSKTGRDGIGLQSVRTGESCDVIITNVLLMDALLGLRRTSIGIREGRISAIGRAGNPDTMEGVEVVVGGGTIVVSGDDLIATAGAVDPHVHGLSPKVMEAALAAGVTTVMVQEFGPCWGVGANSPCALRRTYAAFDAWPINVGVLGRGGAGRRGPTPTTTGCCAIWPNSPSTRPWRTGSRTRWTRCGSAGWRTWCCGDRRCSRRSRTWC